MELENTLRAAIQKLSVELCSPSGPFAIGMLSVGGATVKGFTKAPPSLREIVYPSLRRQRDREFFVYLQERMTYGRVYEEVCGLTAWLGTLGLSKGDRIGISMRNNPEWMTSFLAITCAGYVAVGVNSLWTESEITYGVEDSDVRVYICDMDRLRRSTSVLIKNPHIICVLARESSLPDTDPSLRHRIHLWKDVVRAKPDLLSEPSPTFPLSPEDPAAILYTSGSTGFPKGVVLTHRNLVSRVEFGKLSLIIRDRLSPTPPGDIVILLAIPLFHVTALVHVFLMPAFGRDGSKIVMMQRWDAAEALRIIEAEKITAVGGVPTMTQDLLESPELDRRNTSSLTSISAGGAATPPSQNRRVKAKFPMIDHGQGYGMTETSGGIAAINSPFYESRLKSTGLPIPIVDVKLIDENCNEVKGRGELVVKSCQIMKEYWKKPVETKKTIISINGDPGWLRTGDIAEIDQEGYIYIVDRAKDIIIRGGENISCTEVEAAFYNDPSVLECAAVPIPDKRLGEVVGLIVVIKHGHLLNVPQLLSSVQGLASFKIPSPENIFLTSSALPRGKTDKIDKLALRKLLTMLKTHHL